MGPVGTETTRAGDGRLVWKNAAQRQERTFLPPPDQCPLDPSASGRPTEVPADSYDAVVFENRFPSLRGPSTIPGTGGRPHPPDPPDLQFGPHLQVFTVRRVPGKLKYLAGTESGMAVWVNDIVPETATRRLREAR
jgi:galactose-1-phosphate uridylyltransferase